MKRPGSDFLKIKTTKGFLKDLERDKKSKIGDRPFFYKNGTGPKKQNWQNWGQTLFLRKSKIGKIGDRPFFSPQTGTGPKTTSF